jgi:hypothetical protein
VSNLLAAPIGIADDSSALRCPGAQLRKEALGESEIWLKGVAPGERRSGARVLRHVA